METWKDNEVIQVKAKDLGPPIASMSALKDLRDDLVQLDDPSNPSIIHLLRERFLRDIIYTSVGDILVSINPFKRLPLYTPQMIDKYAHRGLRDVAPHVFTIAADAYNRIVELGESQSILIRGKSGAGKTEATKQCLQYFSEVAGSESNGERGGV